jgi:phosphoserine phosphatase
VTAGEDDSYRRLPPVPPYAGFDAVETWAMRGEGVVVVSSGGSLLTAEEARRLAEHLLEAAAWSE